MQATFLKRILPFCLTLLVGIGVTVAIGRLVHGKRLFTYRVSKSYACGDSTSNYRRYHRRSGPTISIREIPDAQIPPFFDSQMSEGHSVIRMNALFDSSGRVTEVKFPDFTPYNADDSSETQRRSRRLEQELMDSAAQQVRGIDFRPSPFSQWLNVETSISKKAPGRGCSSVLVKVSDQNGMRWERETLAEGRRCGANFSSF